MKERMAVGMHLMRNLAGFAVAGVFAFMPGLGRGTRPMPIDPSVQAEAPDAIRVAVGMPGASRPLRLAVSPSHLVQL